MTTVDALARLVEPSRLSSTTMDLMSSSGRAANGGEG